MPTGGRPNRSYGGIMASRSSGTSRPSTRRDARACAAVAAVVARVRARPTSSVGSRSTATRSRPRTSTGANVGDRQQRHRPGRQRRRRLPSRAVTAKATTTTPAARAPGASAARAPRPASPTSATSSSADYKLRRRHLGGLRVGPRGRHRHRPLLHRAEPGPDVGHHAQTGPSATSASPSRSTAPTSWSARASTRGTAPPGRNMQACGANTFKIVVNDAAHRRPVRLPERAPRRPTPSSRACSTCPTSA